MSEEHLTSKILLLLCKEEQEDYDLQTLIRLEVDHFNRHWF